MRTATVNIGIRTAEVLYQETGKDTARMTFNDAPSLVKHLVKLTASGWNIKTTKRQ